MRPTEDGSIGVTTVVSLLRQQAAYLATATFWRGNKQWRVEQVACMRSHTTCLPACLPAWQGVVNMIDAAKVSGGVKHLVLVSSMLTDPANR